VLTNRRRNFSVTKNVRTAKVASFNWDRRYHFLNIFAENFSEKIGSFNSKQG
jgi:hypothetical protein